MKIIIKDIKKKTKKNIIEKTLAQEFKLTDKEFDKCWENFKKTDLKHDDFI